MEMMYLLVGLAVGAAVGFLIAKVTAKSQPVDDSQLQQAAAERDRLNRELTELQRNHGSTEGLLHATTEERDRLRTDLANAQDELRTLSNRLEAGIEKFKLQEARMLEQRQELEELNKRFNTEFENLANRILEEKSKVFTEKNKENIDSILSPLRERIKDFEEKVERNYGEEKKEKAELRGEIKKLMELNQRISDEANNLASSLKGDNKKMGNWGELMLERILESSGLERDREYFVQYSMSSTDEEKTARMMPDVVIQLPDQKHIIIDSKVSLVAYDRMVNAQDGEAQERELKLHVASVKAHVDGLNKKAYHTAKDLDTPDFVLMFMPIESSFSQAVRADNDLFNFAWDRKVVIVSPSTLLATLRTIAAIWKQERQTRNALLIAEKSGQLYDKFVAFAEDMLKVGQHLDRAQNAQNEAVKKLSEGRGNLVNRTQELRKLGAKTSKQIPAELLTENDGEETDEE